GGGAPQGGPVCERPRRRPRVGREGVLARVQAPDIHRAPAVSALDDRLWVGHPIRLPVARLPRAVQLTGPGLGALRDARADEGDLAAGDLDSRMDEALLKRRPTER